MDRWDSAMMEGYDAAQICLNGHVVTNMAASSPEFQKKHCRDCGATTVMACPKCSAQILGHYHVRGVLGVGSEPKAPTFCHECGKPYPWTESRIEAAKEMAREIEGLDDDEREFLAQSIDDIVRDTPRTQLASSRFKRFLAKMGKGSAEAMREIAVDLATEAAKKSMGL